MPSGKEAQRTCKPVWNALRKPDNTSDAFPAYDNLYYGAPYEMRSDKKETYSVEAVNADLRHYLKRLARKSRCFSRRLDSLLKNLRIFAYCYNQRQLMKQKYPQYNLSLIDFLYPL